MTDRFCPRCGSTVERAPDEPLPGEPRDRDAALCDACYLDDFDLVDAPDRIEVPVCSTCGAVKRGESWRDVGARDYVDVAVDEATERLGVHLRAREVEWGVEPEQVDETTVRLHCRFTGVVRDTPVAESVEVPVTVSNGTCDRCGRVAGGYHNAVVQVRAAGRTPTAEERDRAVELAHSLVADREASGDRDAFVADVTETDAGVDVRLSTSQLGRAVAAKLTEEYGGTVDANPTLVTEDEDGEEVYRVTYAVRLPEFTPGDVIDPEDGGGPVLVTGADDRLTGVRLATGEEYAAAHGAGTSPDARRLGTRADGVETAVVTVEDDHAVRVIDPETHEAVSVPRPDYLDPDAGTVEVVRHRDGLHVLP